MSVVPKLVFYPTLLYNILLEKFTSRNWYDRIDQTILVGALPFKSMARELLDNKVKGVISLNEEYELERWVVTAKEWKELGVDTLYLPTVDLIAAPSQDNLKKGVDFILGHGKNGDSVYIHCKAGRTRSATLAACYLMQQNRCNPEVALSSLKRKRPHVWLRQEQLDALNCYYRENVKKLDTGTAV